MSYLHVCCGTVSQYDEPETVDVKVSPALEMLIEAKIVDVDNGVDFGYQDEYRFELMGPWQGSDYSGDDVTESNQRSLYRDYPQFLWDTTRYSGWSSYGLQIEPTFGQGDEDEAEFAVALAEILIGLVNDYPLYDEEDNSALIHERAQASWDQYVRSDLEREISKLTGLDIDLDDAEDGFWELLMEHDIFPESEGHRDVYFRGIGDRDFLLAMARKGIEAGGLDWDSLSDLTPEGYALAGDVIRQVYVEYDPRQMAIL